FLILVASCGGSPTSAPEATEDQTVATEAAPVGNVDVEALITERCGDCHSADRVFQQNYSEEQWSQVFDDMIQKGANVNEEEKGIMIDWLISRD
ncbi:MAG: hypothetical protein ACK2TV_00140, partial [Anaerolineales bacterium]